MPINRPGEIDNTALVLTCGGVKLSARMSEDFVLLSEEAWEQLHAW